MSKPDAKKPALQRRKRQERARRRQKMAPSPQPLAFPMGGRIGGGLSFYKFWGEKVVSVFRLHSGLKSSGKD